MFSRNFQRLVKEALISIYRDSRTSWAKDYPIYYFAANSNLESLGYAVNALQTLPQIPWPDDKCIILAEDTCISNMIDDNKLNGLIWIVRNKNFKALLNSPDESELFWIGHVVLAENRLIHKAGEHCFMVHQNNVTINEKTYEPNIEKRLQFILEQFNSLSLKSAINKNKFREYMHRVCPNPTTKECWIAYDPKLKIPQPGLAADILGFLSNLAVPCHYVLRSRFSKGFGPTAAIRKLALKPIFTVVNYNRIYQYFKSIGSTHFEILPHFRSGHVRHFWKESGIDRFQLPNDPLERLKIAQIKKVRRLYIQPMWVGERNFSVDDVQHEVATKEIELKPI